MKKMSFVALIALASTGCSITKTRFMHVDSDGTVKESNQPPAHGVPAMIQVPTHKEVTIMQTDFFMFKQEGNDEPKLVHIPEATKRTAKVEQVLMSRMVMVDPKRPISGVGSFGITYHGGTDAPTAEGKGYINKLNYFADDETITNTASLISTVLPFFKTGNPGEEPGDNLVTQERVIAMRRFPINCSKDEIDGFLMQYINGCNEGDCKSSPAYAR